MIGAKADAGLAQGAARLLRQALDVARNLRAIDNAEILGHPECNAARNSLEAFAGLELRERSQQFRHMLAKPEVDAPLHLFQRLAGQAVVGG